ncbi:MAG: Serine/threonine protein kinaserelated protein [Schlesneria sp.]|nr:Serine/threonine protein kinaserelated protein [Schlesneria sp.]
MASSTEQPDSSGQPTATKASGKGMTHLGKYRLIRKLGQGGMGEVYLAEDTKLGRHAAVKVLSKQLAGKSDFVQRFQREARAMAKMNHDNAVSVYDVDEHQGFHFVAMEYIDGKSMQKWMDELGKLSIGDALHVVLRCSEALMVAHNQNLIHRDIKPDNIMLTSKGKVKVADFGLAKATDEDMSMTQSGTGLGTPYYMAPEQARNAKHVDSRTDVYAIGITLYYFVTGKLPFAGDSVIQIITSKEKGHFTPARKLNPEVSERLDLIIDKLIAKDLNARCKDCAEVIKLLTSLGLESPSLSFITAPDRVVQTSAAAAGRATTTQVAVARTIQMPAPGRTSAEDAARSKPVPSTTDQSWIVQYKTSQGKDTIGKFTTLQIQQAFKNKTLDQKAKAKKNVAEQFMPIGYFPEFEKYAEGRVIKDQADKKAGDMKSAYKEIERQYDRRGWTRWFRNLASGTFGMISLVIWLGVIFGGIFALWYFRQPLWDGMAGLLNSK